MDMGRFLCRDEAERRRITDVGRALRPGIPVLIVFFVVAGLSGVGSYGWQALLPTAIAIAAYAVLWALNMPRRGRPEFAYAGAFVLTELMLALSLIVSRGSRASYFVVLVIPVLFISVLFPKRAVIAAGAFGTVLMLAVAFGADLNEVRSTPAVSYAPVFVLISLVFTALALRDLDDASRRSAFVDDLTRALNRTALAPRLAELTHQAAATGKPVAVIVGDIDRFKAVNDRYGHVVGDAVLKEVVRRLSDCVSAFEPVYRLGGEEFLILLPGRDTAAAQEVALGMWQAVRESPIEDIRVTMSFGVAACPGERFDFDSLFASADRALYAAKQGGRDWVRSAPEILVAPGDREDLDRLLAGSGAQREHRAPLHVPATDHAPVEPVGWTEGSDEGVTGARRVTEDLEREHILDLNRRLSSIFRIIAVGAFALIASAIPWFGWQPLIAPMLGAVPYYLLSRHADRFRYPGRALTAGWALFQTAIAIGFMSATGAPLFALPLLILMLPGRAAVLRPRHAAAATLFTAALMILVAFDLDASRVLSTPSVVLFPLALLLEAGYVGSIVGRSAVGHRGAGIVDELTGLLNRTALTARVLELDAQSSSAPRQVGMLLIDLDHFKQINDRVGHAAGDVVLREAGARIRAALRSYESAYRIGGEEVLILLPHADVEAATEVAERLRNVIGGSPCGGLAVTVSVGVGVTEPGEQFVFGDVFQRADAALYEAKRLGRDRVCSDASASDFREHALLGVA
jgi:diguanylate cyclase (GGDEF)-like protein